MPVKAKGALGAVVLVVFLVLPGLLGRGVESELRSLHEPLAVYLGVPVEVESFERGWFASKATVCAAVLPDEKFCARYAIQHGPLLRSGHWGLGWIGVRATPILDPNLQQRLAAMGDDEPLVLTAHTGLGGTLHAQLTLASIDGDLEGVRLSSEPLVAEFSYSPRSERVTSATTWPSAKLVAPQGTVSFSSLAVASDGVHLGRGYVAGTNSFSLDSVEVGTVERGQFRLTELSSEGVSQLDDAGDYSASMTLDVGALRPPSTQESTKVGMTLAVSGVDFEKMLALQASQANVEAAAAGDPTALLQAMQALVVDGIRLDLSRFEMTNESDERVFARLQLALAPGPEGVDPTLGIVHRLGGDGELRCTRSTLERFLGARMIEGWLEAGLATIDGAELTAKLELAEAKLKVGSQTLPLPLLFALLGQKPT